MNPDKPLTQKDLEGRPCEEPGCKATSHDHVMLLVARCHPRRGVRATYRAGVLMLQCQVCERFIANFAVARDPAS